MLHKCANASCSNRLLRLSEGKLFQVESELFQVPAGECRSSRPRRRVEHYWLCSECAPHWTLAFEKGRGMIVVPRPDNRPPAGILPADVGSVEGVAA
jgi:hypothetical protein